jgi:hypothetical protein
MWPEAVNRRMRCSGVRFNLATSAPASCPESNEEEGAEGKGEGESKRLHMETTEKKRKEREEEIMRRARGAAGARGSVASGYTSAAGSVDASARDAGEVRDRSRSNSYRNADVVCDDRRPPSLESLNVRPLADGYGGHREGGWEAVGGAGSSWGEGRCVCVCVCVYTHTHMHMYVCMNLYMHACKHTHTHSLSHTHTISLSHTHTTMYICIYIYIYICTYAVWPRFCTSFLLCFGMCCTCSEREVGGRR